MLNDDLVRALLSSRVLIHDHSLDRSTQYLFVQLYLIDTEDTGVLDLFLVQGSRGFRLPF